MGYLISDNAKQSKQHNNLYLGISIVSGGTSDRFDAHLICWHWCDVTLALCYSMPENSNLTRKRNEQKVSEAENL